MAMANDKLQKARPTARMLEKVIFELFWVRVGLFVKNVRS